MRAITLLLLAMLLPIGDGVLACGAPLSLRVEHERITLQLQPGERAAVWFEEHGSDIALITDDGRTVDSAPGRHALEPLTVQADRDGRAAIGFRLLSGIDPPRLSVRRRCDSAAVAALLDALARQQRGLIDDGDPLRGIAATALGSVALLLAPASATDVRGWLLLQLAWVARAGGYLAEAGQLYGFAAQHLERHDPVAAAWASLGAAQASMNLGQPDSGERLRRAGQRAKTAGLPFAAAIAAHDGCVWLRARGDAGIAADCLATVAERFRRLDEPREQTRALSNRATALEMQGRFADARRTFEQAAAVGASLDPRMTALLAGQRAQAARLAGDYRQALDLLRDALQAVGDEAHPLDRAHVLRLLGQTYSVIGEPQRALDYFDAALAIYRSRGVAPRAAAVEVTMAQVLESVGNRDRAVLLLERATATLQSHGTRNESLLALLQLARLQWFRDRPAAAQRTIEQLEVLRDRLSWPLAAQLTVLELRMQPPTAPAAVEATLQPLLARASEAGLLLLQLDIAAELVAQRFRFGRPDAAHALAFAQAQAARNVLDRLRSPGLRHAVLRRLEPLALAPMLQLAEHPGDAEVAHAIALFEWLRRNSPPPSTAGYDDDRLSAVERLLTEEMLTGELAGNRRHRLMLALETERGQHPALASPRPADVRLPRIEAGDAWLYFALGDRRGGVLVGSGGGWRWHGGIDTARLRLAADALHRLLASGHVSTDAVDAAASEVAAALRWNELFDMPPRRLRIVADADIAGLPWAVLPAPGTSQPLGGEVDIVLLQHLRGSTARTPTEVRLLSAAPSAGGVLATLPDVLLEPAQVAGHWQHRLPVLQLPADQEQVDAALAVPGGVVHIAAHGRADRGLIEESGLWVLDPGHAGMRFMSALRLRQLQHRSSLVVVSACETGYSLAASSFGIGGVAGSIVDAGGQAVVSTLWPVSDRAARTLADALHAALAEGLTPGGALAQAQATLRSQRALRHPTHWAGWTLLQAGPLWREDAARP